MQSAATSFGQDRDSEACFGAALRRVADGLIAKAETLPRKSRAAFHLRDAAASLLDAETALEALAAGVRDDR